MKESGTIRSREAKQVIGDILVARGVSRAVYKVTASDLHLLINGRCVTFSLRAGMSFCALESLRKSVERAIDELQAARDKRQVDLEDAIREAVA